MTERTRGIPLVRRVLAENRRLAYILTITFVVNVLGYVFIVYPLSQRVANVAERDRAAEQALAAAKADFARINGAFTGKDRAAKELTTFYSDILPGNLARARRLAYPRLPQLARQSNLRYERASYEPDTSSDSTLTTLKISMELTGTYDDMRAFIHQLETAPEFIVIDHVELAEGAQGGGGTLRVVLQLSTFYRTTPQ